MIRFASTFLSHSWKQKPLVEDVARELARRGVLAWIDANELPVGIDLDTELRKAADAQITLTAFLSAESIASPWCREELEPRLARADTEGSDAVHPVFLGDPFQLVSASRELKRRWLTPDGTRVRRLGIHVADLSTADSATIARRLADAQYHHLALREARSLVIVLDQRGSGRRVGKPDFLPPSWREQPWPALVFRPDLGERTVSETLTDTAWTTVRDAFSNTLAAALGTRARREVYVSGHAQLAFAWLVGQELDRSSGVKLVVHNPRIDQRLMIDFDDQRFLLPLPQLPASAVVWDDPARGPTAATVSLYLGDPGRVNAVNAHRAATGDTTPLATHATGVITTADEVIAIARWVATAAAQRPVTLYTSLPFHVLPLLAALLKHEIGRVTVMERDSDASVYRACALSA